MPTAIATKPFTVKGVDLFRAGTQTDSLGRSRTWSRADLLELAETYNSGVGTHDAPVQVAHDGRSMEEDIPGFTHSAAPLLIPTGEAAYGWVERLYVDGDVLRGDLNYVHPDFVEALERKTYRKRSISIYPRDHSANPHKGKLSLRHVAYVGLPAVKGLQDHSERSPALADRSSDSRFLNYDFSESDSLTYEFEELADFVSGAGFDPIRTIATIFRNLRENLIASKGVDEAEKIYPTYLIESLESYVTPMIDMDGIRAEMSAIASSYSNPNNYAEKSMIGGYLTKLMKDKGIDVAAGAEATGIKSDRLQALMNDEAEPTSSEASKLATALSVSAERFKAKEKTTDMTETDIQAQDFTELIAEVAALRTQVNGLTTENQQLKDERERDRITNFVESMASQEHRKVLPTKKQEVIAKLLAMPHETTVSFSEGGQEVTKTPRDIFMDAIAGGTPIWSDADMPTQPTGGPPNVADFSEEELARKARDLRAKRSEAGQPISYAEAINLVYEGVTE